MASHPFQHCATMRYIWLPLIAVLAAPAPSGAEHGAVAVAAPDVSPAVQKTLDRADRALRGEHVPARSLYRGDLTGRMRRLPQAPPPAEPVVRTFDYELLAKIVAANKLKREKRHAAGIVEPYRRPEPNYLAGTGVLASVPSKPSQRDAIAKARQQLRRISLQRQTSLPRPST